MKKNKLAVAVSVMTLLATGCDISSDSVSDRIIEETCSIDCNTDTVPDTEEQTVNLGAQILDTLTDDTGELRIELSDIASGTLTASVQLQVDSDTTVADSDIVNNTGYITLSNSGDTVAEIILGSDSKVKYRNEDSQQTVIDGITFAEGYELQIQIIWDQDGYSISLDGGDTMSDKFEGPATGSNVNRLSFRLSDTDSPSQYELNVDNIVISGDALSESFSTDTYTVGDDLVASFYSSNGSEVTVQEMDFEATEGDDPVDSSEPEVTVPDDDEVVVTDPTIEPGDAEYPSDLMRNYDQWKITYPDGEEVKQLYQEENEYFYVNEDKNGIVFFAPVRSDNGTTTNSSYIRSELRERTEDGDSDIYWTTTGTHVAYVQQAITHLPIVKPHLVATQIHGNKDDGIDDAMVLRLEEEHLFLSFNGNKLREDVTVKTDYALGTLHEVIFEVIDGKHYVYYSEDGGLNDAYIAGNAQQYLVKDGSNDYVMDLSYDQSYFKVGNYTQSNAENEGDYTDDADNYGEVVVYDFWVAHEDQPVDHSSKLTVINFKPELTQVFLCMWCF